MEAASPRTKVRSDSYLLGKALVLVVAAAALDVTNALDRGGWTRYLLLGIPLVGIVLIRLARPSPYLRRPGTPDKILLLLLLFGLPGTLYGILVLSTPATALPIFVPMVVAFLYLGVLEEPTGREARSILRALEWTGTLYIVASAIVTSGLASSLAEYRQFRNAGLFFATLGLASAITLRHWWRATVLASLWVVAFVGYPSGTSVLAVLTIAFSLLMMPRRATRVRPYLFAAVAAGAVLLVVVNFSSWIQVSNDYFALVGKLNNNSSRLAVWTEGLERFEESPIVGQVFSGPTVTTAVREGARGEIQIPFHNDYIHFLANGGIIGLVLLLAWIGTTEVIILRRFNGFLEVGEHDKAALLRVLLVAYNVFFVTAAFNPTIMGVSRSASIFSIYAMMMAVGSPRRGRLE